MDYSKFVIYFCQVGMTGTKQKNDGQIMNASNLFEKNLSLFNSYFLLNIILSKKGYYKDHEKVPIASLMPLMLFFNCALKFNKLEGMPLMLFKYEI